MEETQVVLDIVVHVEDHPKKQFKNGSFSTQNGPRNGTTAWETPY